MTTSLNRPVFVSTDTQATYDLIKSTMEAVLGRKLFPAQPETLTVGFAAYLAALTNLNIQHTGEQELVNYATAENLDQLGAFWGEYGVRLPAQAAATTLQFTIPVALGVNKIIPAGTRVRTEDQLYIFATDANATITAGDTTTTVTATAQTPGAAANGYTAGQIATLFDQVSGVSDVTNTTTSNSGADAEDDDRYRTRLKLAPNAITDAGTEDSYKFYALSADSTITTVSVRSPSPDEQIAARGELAEEAAQIFLDELVSNHGASLGTATAANMAATFENYVSIRYFYVEIYVLVATGTPSAEVIEKVRVALSSQNVRPINDEIRVKAPAVVNYTLTADVTIYSDTDAAQMQTNLNTAATNYANTLSQTLNGDVIPSQIIDALSITGVYKVELTTPSAPIAIAYNERAVATTITINIVGAVERV